MDRAGGADVEHRRAVVKIGHARGAGRWSARLLALALPAFLLLPGLPATAVPALAASGQPALPVSFPAPMAAPGSASAHLPPAGGPLDPRFASPSRPAAACGNGPSGGQVATVPAGAPSDESQPARQPASPAAQACAAARSSRADAGYRQASSARQPGSPNPDWTPLAPAHAPQARFGPATVYDQAHQQVVLFGGSQTEGGTVYASTWTWDGGDWTNRTPSLKTSPAARALAQAAYDQAHGQVVLFGGSAGGAAPLGDTWVWDGAAWTQRAPASAPPARFDGAMAWDPNLGRILLYGGRGAGGRTYGDTWAWDGTSWTQLQPASAPGPRSGPALATDDGHRSLLLFGGSAGGSSALDDTWSFDGRAWKRLAPASRPPARTGAGMVFDADLGRLVLTGGAQLGAAAAPRDLNDTWTWDGSRWSQLSGIASPAPREELGLAYDAASRQVVMVGGSLGAAGRRGATTLGDTSALALGVPTLTESVDRGANGLYPSGGTVAYTLTVGNSDLLSGLVVSVQDQLPASLAVASAPISILDVGTGASLACGVLPVTCSTANNTLSVTGLGVGALDSLSIRVQLVAVGLGRACSTATDRAIASSLLGSSAPVSIPITICDTGLGLENWWTFVNQAVGPQAQASVNVSNGNLVVQQTDTTPIQAHGHLAYVLNRTYNSQDTTLLSFPGSFGAGWNLDIAETGDLAGLGVGSTGLFVPPVSSVLNPLAVTLIDADGTRHVFQFRGLNATIDITGLLGGLLGSPLSELVPNVLSLDTSRFNHLCVDQTFSAPAGVHLGLYRYIEVQSANLLTPCSVPDPGTSPVLLGFATVSPQRVRDEFSFDGHLLDVRDGSGTDLRYAYQNQPLPGIAIGPLTTIFEPRSCSLPLAATCRAFRFSYSGGETDVTDPAGRVTKYLFDATPLTPRLVRVVNPDGSQVSYAYQKNAFSGVDCHGSANQLCSITDPRGNTSSFTYTPPPLVGLNKLATMTDRRGSATAFTYHTSPDFVTADQAGHRSRFQAIDSSGRVGEIDEGDTADNYPGQSLRTWDVAGATCRQPDAVVDNDLCRQVVRSLTAQTPDQDISHVYSAEGGVLSWHTASPVLDTTQGFHTQYFQADGSVRTFDDTVQGSGRVSSTGPTSGRADGGTLFAISDRTQSLTARGNAAGSGFAPFLTTYQVDDNTAVNPNAIPAANPCANPASPTSNTGLACEVDAPSFDGTHPTVTRSTYDTFGEKLTMATPKAIAETPAGQPVPAYSYTYYQDSELDLSGSVSAGGWLKGVTDPTGNFVAFAYDRAGDTVRTWDRNATQGHGLADFPGTIAAPPSGAFTETLFGTGGTAYAAPWRYPRSNRDQLGDLTTFTVDNNGNRTLIRPPRGSAAGSGGFDVTQTFDQSDNQISHLTPLEAAANKATTFTYDVFDNRTSATDPNGNVSTLQYDSVNRQVGSAFTRGPWPGDTSTVPPSCRQSTAADAPIPAGRILCSTAASYDGVDNRLSATDANHQVTTFAYDGARRPISQLVPRNAGTLTTLRTDTLHDADGNVTDVCPPREFTEGASTSCTSSGSFSVHRAYDVAGRLASQTSFRTGGAPDTSTFTYDADGNPRTLTDPNGHPTTAAFDLLDRRTSVTQPRDASSSSTTTTIYDPAGNTTAVVQPGGRITAHSYDAANRPVDTVLGADNVSAAAAGLVDANGGTNVRTRVLYDADGHAVAAFQPSAFATSTQSPDPSFMVRSDVDPDGQVTAVFQPRYDTGAHADVGLSTTQASQCPTNPSPQPVAGVPAYPSGVGVCVTRHLYDAAGNAVRTVLPTVNGGANRFVVSAYTDDRLLASVDAPNPALDGGRVTAATYLYDANGKQVKQTDALGHQQTTTYTADELVSQEAAQPNGAVTHVTSHTYDASGNPTVTTDPLGNQSTADYYNDNLSKDVVQQVDASTTNTTRYVYDPAGNLTQKFSPSAVAMDSTNSLGIPITNTYTFDNLPLTSTQAVTPDESVLQRTIYGYDAGGRKTSQQVVLTDTQGVVTHQGGTQRFDYYNNDRLSVETGRTSPTETITHVYDPAGNQASVRDSTSGGSTVASTYYLDNLPRSVDDGSRSSLSAYDGAGQRTARADQVDGTSTRSTTTYTYGDAGQASAMSSSIAGANPTAMAYDAAGHLQQEVDPNGQKTVYAFNPDDTLASRTLTNPAGANVATFTYTYDSNFQNTSQTFSGQGGKQGRQAYTYDRAGRLSTFTDGSNPVQTVTWDHDGNRKAFGSTGSATYNPDDTLATIKDASGTVHGQLYSFRGDLINDGCLAYGYDGFDRQTSVTPTNAAGCPSSPGTTYTYDGLDRQRTTGSTTLHYDGASSVVSSKTSAGVDTAYELTPAGLARAVAVQPPAAGSAQFLSDDGQGNITTVTTSTGALACSVRYDPWGSPLGAQSPQNPCDSGSTINDHFYRGQRLDPVTGSYQLGSRTYQPGKASFLNPDTYRTAQPQTDISVQADPLTQNRYAYVNGDPVNLYDPDGHCSWGSAPWDKGSCWNPGQIKQGAQHVVQSGVQKVNQAEQAVAQKVDQAKQVVASTGQKVGQGVRQAWSGTTSAVGQCFGGPEHTCLKAAAVVAGVVALGVLCVATVGVGCAVAAAIGAGLGAVAGGALGAATCGSGSSLAGCIATGALVGAVGGAVFAGAGVALAAAGAVGLGATVVAGAASGLASGFAGQTLAGHYDVGQLALDTVLGGATAGVLRGLGGIAGDLRAGLRGGAQRLPQDVAVNPTAPRSLPLTRSIGPNPAQNQAVQNQISAVRAQGARDIRVNQQQVNVNGVRVGVNRPDLQYTLRGQRYYEEYDTASSQRGPAHRSRILANDPAGSVALYTVP
jgi:RHS repeat-associated protein